jgi:hypothetical protein
MSDPRVPRRVCAGIDSARLATHRRVSGRSTRSRSVASVLLSNHPNLHRFGITLKTKAIRQGENPAKAFFSPICTGSTLRERRIAPLFDPRGTLHRSSRNDRFGLSGTVCRHFGNGLPARLVIRARVAGATPPSNLVTESIKTSNLWKPWHFEKIEDGRPNVDGSSLTSANFDRHASRYLLVERP